MAYTNDQITTQVNSILGGGGSWNDVLSAAQQYGVDPSQLAGAYGMTADQGAAALQSQGVDTDAYYQPIQNFQDVTNSGVGGLDAGGVTQMRDWMNQQIAGGYGDGGSFQGGDFFDTGKFERDAGSAASLDEIFQKLGGAASALDLSDADIAAVLGGEYTPEMVKRYREDPNNKVHVGLQDKSFRKDQGWYGDEEAPNYAATYDPTWENYGGRPGATAADTGGVTSLAATTGEAAATTNEAPAAAEDDRSWLQRIQANPDMTFNPRTGEQIALSEAGSYYDPQTGMYYTPIYSNQMGQGQDGEMVSTLTGYRGNTNRNLEDGEDYHNTPYTSYDTEGNKTGEGVWSIDSDLSKQAIMALLMMGGGALAGSALGGAAAAGPGEAGWGLTLDSAGGIGGGSGAELLGGSGALDLGGGLSMGPGGEILGETLAGGGTMTTAEIEALINGAGAAVGPATPGAANGMQDVLPDAVDPNAPGNANGMQDVLPDAAPPPAPPPGSANGMQDVLPPAAPPPAPGGITDIIKNLGVTDIAKLVALLGGAAALGGDSGGGGGYAGYEGGIPNYGASRTQYGYDESRRPGSAPQRYFSDMVYTPGGVSQLPQAPAPGGGAAPAPAPTNAPAPAQGVSDQQISEYINSILSGGGTEAQKRTSILNAALQYGVPPERIAAATGYTIEQVKQYLGLARGGRVARFASGGGVGDLQAGAAGRHLKGPGDGLSDDIPASIDGVQPAALASDEYVISADVVSALGGGSSDAGARKLDEMMDRIRQQAHGTKQQVRPVSDRVLPA